ncbi:hypothetical protein TTHERM_000902830 (macronuclear) [Tetrahymena thermophila SB210]|uniref:Uncharacterized protein n=1 Tax=Tetrahymena thermophila (strain SB210) TaxID=312017 RepID=W7WZZ4_TETTS|nr:hypothetical protein TTHERM_000902830 [Tetrahymena thermophila SB210]EWS71187.1 hypothetical protein TTHERM_000902830 [Tetrahymena thermophila SB210]|eukprot:XP_012656285.1 hypothetical protein TTHERM_000902830 [Tetrahymena thermophila SB210]
MRYKFGFAFPTKKILSDIIMFIIKTFIQQQNFFPFLTRFTLTNKIIGIIIPQMINRGCNKDQSNQQNHKGCKLGFFAYKQSIDLLIAPNGLPDIYTGTEIAIKLLNKLQIKERICK